MASFAPSGAASPRSSRVPASGALEDHLPPHHRRQSGSTDARRGTSRFGSHAHGTGASVRGAPHGSAFPSHAASPAAASLARGDPREGGCRERGRRGWRPFGARRGGGRGGRGARGGRLEERVVEAKICVVCGSSEDVKYKLPCCRGLFCSAACFRQHRQQPSCRPREDLRADTPAGESEAPPHSGNKRLREDEEASPAALRTAEAAGERGEGLGVAKRRRGEEHAQHAEEEEEGECEEEEDPTESAATLQPLARDAAEDEDEQEMEDDQESPTAVRWFRDGDDALGDEELDGAFDDRLEEAEEEEHLGSDELSLQQKEALRSNAELREAFEKSLRLREAFADIASAADKTAALAIYLNDGWFESICDQVMNVIQEEDEGH
ncbi:hypothetical protein BESB_081380 [Besnoitia besnoiti]|uniref:HIT-type domain-containing protein n=1 Tax=Besnoitia besnoiti TaxID=94643 RepID=A0A2A9M4R4_BESBE|nr:hypothetical protein BESB_081380 [Besnoitia besnoiti]PFH32939.1 hypothetical protein BESB_081380 [Besnoitia besnoiti]